MPCTDKTGLENPCWLVWTLELLSILMMTASLRARTASMAWRKSVSNWSLGSRASEQGTDVLAKC